MNNCINLKQKLDRKIYCKYKKSDIKISDCSNCKYKEYKKSGVLEKNKKKSGLHKHKRTKATEISKKIKLIVWERDERKCIFCGTPVTWNYANSHFIKRSQGGLGIERNIMTNCQHCHDLFDKTSSRKNMIPIAIKHFESHYPNWNEKNLTYKKFGGDDK